MTQHYGYKCDCCGKEINSENEEFKKWIQIQSMDLVKDFRLDSKVLHFCTRACLEYHIKSKF